MIKKLTVTDISNMPITWWAEVPLLVERKSFSFSPGVTVIFGPNGCGKSTLLSCLATVFHCKQMGLSCITRQSVDEMYYGFGDTSKKRSGFEIEHDAKLVVHFSPDSNPGLFGGSAAFDDDFMSLGLNRLMRKKSSGQSNLNDFFRIVEAAQKMHKREDKIKAGNVNDYWAKKINDCVTFLDTPTTKDSGLPTMILDEPTRSLDIPLQILVWEAIFKRWSKSFQIIVATHDPFVFGMEGLDAEGNSFIDLLDGYSQTCRNLMKISFDHIAAQQAVLETHKFGEK
jgi:predicted ATPase